MATRTVRLVMVMWLAILSLQSAAGKDDRPNVLFVFADDWGRYASAYAKADGPGSICDVIQTPNFDKIASEGVLFRRAFVSAPSCTPVAVHCFLASIFGAQVVEQF